ncbi:type II toxin-antitoxin system VapC family toxin [Aureimonas leprariae]|uniref:Ribonuclease VapC n=1 Tax=Plantimonas leprariae TaxID=2615207 RepID=A0A7V7PKK9_9HYPH|nr:type II toxin-antitoxin system VapC family toxin [Aureimonas leprariae]KAB0676429.1 type II toxin-antitoxin system VapC family toxin [Aureimonas leprariae]
MFLLDTMVFSENFKTRPNPDVVDWLRQTGGGPLRVSVLTFGEVAAGVEKQRSRDVRAFQRLSDWLDRTRRDYERRTLPFSTEIALRWGALSMQLKRRDLDLFIAATALEHDLTVVTRNVRHFAPTGAKLFNPYEA